MIEYDDILNPVLEKGNMGGIWEDVFFAPKSHFASFAKVPSEDGDRNFATLNKLVDGVDALLPGKKLFKLYGTMEKGSLVAARQGEIDGVSHKISLKIFTPGLESQSLAMLALPNQNWIFYVRTGKKMFRMGGDMFAAKLAADGEVGTGDSTASAKGNSMTFFTYENGYCPEVVDIDAILAKVNVADAGLTVAFVPAHGAVGVLVDATPTITFGEAILDANTMAAFTSQSFQDICTLNSLDVDGNVVAAKPFTAVKNNQVVTITPTTDFAANTIYELKFDATRVISADAQGAISGRNSVRFTTA
jgi:hypothetical protein